jgi:hypothetical protein
MMQADWCVPAFVRNVVVLIRGHPQGVGGDGGNPVHTSRNELGIVTYR